jgi:cobalamin-independent methionine synthase catalytic subunit
MTRPWQPGAVTGIGSLPGTDPVEAARLVFGELPELAHVPELPARGAGADMVGRTAALLIDLPVEIVVGEWRLTAHPGRDLRRARDHLAWDVDAVEAAGADYRGPLKLQAVGPWTLAASLELHTGHRVVSDHGAVRDLGASLAEGLRLHVADLARRVPGATPVLQLDEPSLPAALDGRIPTASGYGTVRAVAAAVARQVLAEVLEVVPAGCRVVHCCAPQSPIGLLRDAGADAVSLDAALLGRAQYDALGEAVDGGMSLWLGLLPSTDADVTLDSVREPLFTLWSELGFPAAQLASSVVPTPACGLSNASPDYVRRALSLLRDVGKAMQDEAA